MKAKFLIVPVLFLAACSAKKEYSSTCEDLQMSANVISSQMQQSMEAGKGMQPMTEEMKAQYQSERAEIQAASDAQGCNVVFDI